MNDGPERHTPSRERVFLLSPATLKGVRGRRILVGQGEAPFLDRLHSGGGVALGRVHSHISSLYFRGKRAYGRRFGRREAGSPVLVITPDRGLVSHDTPVHVDELRAMAASEIDPGNPRYLEPLLATAGEMGESLSPEGEVILLGSIASEKYVEPLLEVLGLRLRIPRDFVGRGDMSRGGLLLRSVREGRELPYIPAEGATRRVRRPPKLHG